MRASLRGGFAAVAISVIEIPTSASALGMTGIVRICVNLSHVPEVLYEFRIF